jgi:hypothetical protein
MMTNEMHEAIQRMIDHDFRYKNLNERAFDAWMDDVQIMEGDDYEPWIILSKTQIATVIDGKMVLINKGSVH